MMVPMQMYKKHSPVAVSSTVILKLSASIVSKPALGRLGTGLRRAVMACTPWSVPARISASLDDSRWVPLNLSAW